MFKKKKIYTFNKKIPCMIIVYLNKIDFIFGFRLTQVNEISLYT